MHLINPRLVYNDLVSAIEQVMCDNTELKAARGLLLENGMCVSPSIKLQNIEVPIGPGTFVNEMASAW
jgi:hypothetical protein